MISVNIYSSIKFAKLFKFTNISSKEIINNIKSDNIIEKLYIKKKLVKLLINNFIIDYQNIYKYNLINSKKILKYKTTFTIKIKYKYIH